MLLGLAGERHHDRASAGGHRTKGGPVERDARGEGRGAEVAIDAAQVQHVIDEVIIGAGAGPQEGARMPGQVQRDAGLVTFPGETLGGAHKRFQLGGLGAKLPEQPDTTDGLRGFVGQQREESDVLFGERVEPVGIAVHDTDHVPHEFHRDGQFGTDALPDLDVTRILRDVGDPLRFGVEGHPAGDALPLLDDLPGGIGVESVADLDAQRPRGGLDERDGRAGSAERADDLLQDEVERLPRIFGGVDERADAVEAVQDAGVAGTFLRWPGVRHGLERVIHVERRGVDGGLADHDGGHAGHAGMGGDVLEDDGAGADLGAFADGDVAEDLGARADEHAGADLRVTVTAGLARAAEGDLMQERDVVGDDAGLAGDEASGVVEQDADAETGGGMDVDGEVLRDERLQVRGELLAAGLPERVRQTMRRDGVEALIPKIRDERVLGRRVTFEGGTDVGAHLRKHFAIGRDSLAEDAEDDGEILAGGCDPFRQALDDALAETGTVEDVAMEHRRQGRLGLGDDGRTGLQLRPEGSFVGADQGDGTGVSHTQD